MVKCANCGKVEVDEESVICEECRTTFPGPPEMLVNMVEAFREMKKRIPGFESINTGVKPVRESKRKPL